jgi:hypothetical protein
LLTVALLSLPESVFLVMRKIPAASMSAPMIMAAMILLLLPDRDL